MKQIIGDKGQRKRRYDPDLARKVNEAVRKGELETKVSEDKGTNADIEAICKKYEEYMDEKNLDTPYDLVSKLKPTKEQILKFSKKLVDYTELGGFKDYTQDYLTALMHASKDDEFVLDFRELNEAGWIFSCIGHELEGKKLTVYGDVDGTGHYAKDSEIVINGDVRGRVGYYAEGCTIYVSGDAGEWIGQYSKRCKITINGNARDCVGVNAEGSEIYIKGDIGGLSKNIGEGTEIYQFKDGKYELIYPEK